MSSGWVAAASHEDDWMQRCVEGRKKNFLGGKEGTWKEDVLECGATHSLTTVCTGTNQNCKGREAKNMMPPTVTTPWSVQLLNIKFFLVFTLNLLIISTIFLTKVKHYINQYIKSPFTLPIKLI